MTDEGEQTSRERRHQATALSLERNAVSLVLEHGFDNVTVDMICEASAVSQRTFFNYFKTKDAAVIGSGPPRIDESRARAFVATDGPDLLPELLELVTSTALTGGADEDLFADRLRMLGRNPQLLHKQMERMSRLEAEVIELVWLRLKRPAAPGGNDAELHEQAELLTFAMLGVLRFVATRWIRGNGSTRAEFLEHTTSLLRKTLRTL